VNSTDPCSYPIMADHIIDLQCLGAYQKIDGNMLKHKRSNI